jgi:hypothetical protein
VWCSPHQNDWDSRDDYQSKLRQPKTFDAVHLVEPVETKLSVLVAVVHITTSQVLQHVFAKLLPMMPGHRRIDK